MDKAKAIEVLKPLVNSYVDYANITMKEEDDDIAEALEMAIEALRQPEIVQCKNCDWNDGTCYCDFHYRDVKPNDYCSWRRTNNG